MNERPKEWFRRYVGQNPYPYQEEIIDDESSMVIINKARQCGMSTALGFKCLLAAISGKVALIVSPSQKQSYRVMQMLETFMAGSPAEDGLIENSNTVKGFDNGGRVLSLPDSPSQVRGYRAHLIVMDEVAHFLNGTDRKMYEAIVPSASLGGQIILSSTPLGDRNLFAEKWSDPKIERRITVNWSQCPALVRDEPRLRAQFDSISFDQEYNNVFHKEALSEFPMSLIESCVDKEAEYETNSSGPDLVAGVDVGRRIDLSAVAIVRNLEEGHIRLVEKLVWRDMPLPEQEDRLVAIAGRVGRLIFDRGGLGEQMGDALPQRCSNAFPFTFTYENKTEMFLSLKRRFEQKAISIPFDRRLMDSLNSIRRYWRLGRTIIDAERTDETGHADEATALALACFASVIPEEPEAVIDIGVGQSPFGSRRW